MTLKQFFRFVELQTKVASFFPMVLGSLFAWYHYRQFNWLAFIFFVVALLGMDMFTTGLNNLFDAKRNRLEKGYTVEYQNILLADHISLRTGEIVLLSLFLVVLVCGLLLVFQTNLIVLFLGMLSFGIAFIYSYGPVPINHTPFSEVLSGVTMGGIITFLAVYIHIWDQGLIALQGWNLSLNLKEILRIIFLGVPFIMTTANIMLANNMSDLDEDVVHHRYTLPYYIGLSASKVLFSANYLIAYLAIIVMVILKILPITALLVLLTLPKVYQQVRKFINHVSKSDTFVFAVKNYLLIALSYCISLVIALGLS